ncbi:hypothetical protein KIH41_10690 [Litoribacter ruber]|uniref:DUF3185 family protein n=1 Tax=Litoribacter ruber TaxID=702568 RepID=A0AAP2CM12_9BACT|nr:MULTISPECIES: hypothetical protein [Litoribacter]MBS9525045.1 hypothetical protein [Litoribacter alkaliphilus]MBT0811742.1 hypothetical protein [Litoribacter ruber]
MKVFGMILVVLGIIMLIITGFSYTTEETIIDAGPLNVTAEQEETINWPPYVGGIALITGVVLLAMSRDKN